MANQKKLNLTTSYGEWWKRQSQHTIETLHLTNAKREELNLISSSSFSLPTILMRPASNSSLMYFLIWNWMVLLTVQSNVFAMWFRIAANELPFRFFSTVNAWATIFDVGGCVDFFASSENKNRRKYCIIMAKKIIFFAMWIISA